MSEQTLPAVAKTVYTDCKKCGAERYHVVLAHKTSTSAQVQCEICKSKKTYKLATLKKPRGMNAGLAKATAARAAKSASARAAAHEAEYQTLLGAATESSKYNMKLKFGVNHKIEHPKFGTGVVKTVYPDKVEVVFADEIRSLVHNRV